MTISVQIVLQPVGATIKIRIPAIRVAIPKRIIQVTFRFKRLIIKMRGR